MAKKSAKRPARKPAKRAKAAPRKPAGRSKAARAAGPRLSATAAAALEEKTRAIELLTWAHELTGHLTADFPEEHLLHQTCPTDNHVLWTLGHLAMTYSWCASLIDGKLAPLPETYQGMFGYKSVPSPDAGKYPGAADVRRQHHVAFARLMEAIGGLRPEDAHKPPAADSFGFAVDRLDVVYKACWHEGWHQGQISTLRRSLGMPGKM